MHRAIEGGLTSHCNSKGEKEGLTDNLRRIAHLPENDPVISKIIMYICENKSFIFFSLISPSTNFIMPTW